MVDLTAGSGSTAVAAQNTNRDCIAIEQNEEYYDIATERVNSDGGPTISGTGQQALDAFAD